MTNPRPHCQGGAGEKTEPTSTRSGFRFGKFCSTKLLCVFLTVVVGLGCSFALSSYGSGGVSSELLVSVLVPDAAAIPVSNRTGARRLLAPHADSSCARVSPQVLDLSNTTPKNEFSPTVRGTAFAPSAALPTIVDIYFLTYAGRRLLEDNAGD